MSAGAVSAPRALVLLTVLAAGTMLAACAEDAVGPAATARVVPVHLPSPRPGGGALAVLVDDPAPAAGSTYTVALVDAGGRTAASVRAARRTIDGSGSRCVLARLPVVSASGHRVFYLDGDATLAYLDPDGGSAMVRRLGDGSAAEIAFSVSPDEARVAVTTLTRQGTSFHEELRVEGIDGANPVTLASRDVADNGAALISWPAGWRGASLLVATGLPVPQANCHALSQVTGYDVLDAATGATHAHLCATVDDAVPSGPPSAAGVLCAGHDARARPVQAVESIEAWDGSSRVLRRSLCALSGDLSPDGHQVAATVDALVSGGCGPGDGLVHLLGPGNGDVATSAAGTALGWLDAGHIVVRGAGPMEVLDAASGRVAPVAATGDLQDTLPTSI